MSIRVWPGKDSLSPKESWLMTQWLHICIYVCMIRLYYMLYINIYVYTYTCAIHRYITGDSRENPDLKPSFPVQACSSSHWRFGNSYGYGATTKRKWAMPFHGFSPRELTSKKKSSTCGLLQHLLGPILGWSKERL